MGGNMDSRFSHLRSLLPWRSPLACWRRRRRRRRKPWGESGNGRDETLSMAWRTPTVNSRFARHHGIRLERRLRRNAPHASTTSASHTHTISMMIKTISSTYQRLVSHPLITAGRELGTVTSAVCRVTPLVVVKVSGSPSLLVKLLATALTPGRKKRASKMQQ